MNLSAESDLAVTGLVHRAIAAAFPWLFLNSVLSLAGELFPRFPVPGPLFWAVLACTGALALALSALFRTERLDLTAAAQSLALVLLAAYAVSLLSGTRAFPARFTPDAGWLVILSCLAAQWIWTLYIEDSFAPQEDLRKALEGKDGRELFDAVRAADRQLGAAWAGLERLGRSCTIASLWPLALLVVCMARRTVPTFPVFILVALLFVVLLLVRALARLYVDERDWAGQGLAGAFRVNSGRLSAGAALLAVSSVTALLFSSATAVLPPDIFRWLFSLLSGLRERTAYSAPPVRVVPPSVPEYLKDVIEPFGSMGREQGLDLAWVTAGLKYLFLAAFTAAALWFLFGSFFSRDLREFFRERRLLSYLRRWLRALVTAAENLVTGFRRAFRKEGRSGAAASRARSRKEIEDFVRARIHPAQSREKRKEIGRLSASFLKLVDWGTERGMPWRPSLAPGEYGAILSAPFPPLRDDLSRCSCLFEKALYSADLLGSEEEARFFASIAAIVGPKAGAASARRGQAG